MSHQVSVYKDNVLVVPSLPFEASIPWFTLNGFAEPAAVADHLESMGHSLYAGGQGWKDWIMEIPADLTGTYTIDWYFSGVRANGYPTGTFNDERQMFPGSIWSRCQWSALPLCK